MINTLENNNRMAGLGCIINILARLGWVRFSWLIIYYAWFNPAKIYKQDLCG